MKTLNYVKILLELQAEHGDLEVELYGIYGDRVAACLPKIGNRLILSGKQRKPAFWAPHSDSDKFKGEKVVRLY